MTNDNLLRSQATEDESGGVVAGIDTWQVVVDSLQRITTKYLASWEHWLASSGSTSVSSLRETT